VCYSVFEVGSDGKAKVRRGISEGDIEDAKRAEVCCPTGAINIVDTLDFLNNDDNSSSGSGSSGSLLDAFLSILDDKDI